MVAGVTKNISRVVSQGTSYEYLLIELGDYSSSFGSSLTINCSHSGGV